MARMMKDATNWKHDYYTQRELAYELQVSVFDIIMWYNTKESPLFYVEKWWEGLTLPPKYYKDKSGKPKYYKGDLDAFKKFLEDYRKAPINPCRLYTKNMITPKKYRKAVMEEYRKKLIEEGIL